MKAHDKGREIGKVIIHKGSTKGTGYLDWERLEQRFREIGELTEQDHLHSVTLKENGLCYTTKIRK